MIFDHGQLRVVRRAKKMQQDQVAVALHCTPSTISSMENGRTKITAEMLAVVCSFYGVEIDNFFVKELL